MNRIEKFFGLRSEAKIRFLDGEFEVRSLRRHWPADRAAGPQILER
jgi:hypothetical protein